MLGVLAIVVTILTVLFNLVGTLCISVMAGMMAGASRRFNWQVISVSLVPPAVAVVLGWISKSELDVRRYFSLSAVCLGAFWITWLATYILMSLEKKSPQASGQRTSAQSGASHRLNTSPAGDGTRCRGAIVKADAAGGPLNLDLLQGTWRCETGHPDEDSTGRVLVVKGGKFSLSIVNANGQARVLDQGDVTVTRSQERTKLVISKPSGLEASDG